MHFGFPILNRTSTTPKSSEVPEWKWYFAIAMITSKPGYQQIIFVQCFSYSASMPSYTKVSICWILKVLIFFAAVADWYGNCN